jgi:hypothetical protein
MEAAGICRFRFSHSPLGHGVVEIAEEFWPYQRSAQESLANDSAEYVAAIRTMLRARACINTMMSAADEILAREWFDRGISLDRIEQSILIGCIRKYVSWRNNQTRTLIGSLKYFAPVLEEMKETKTNPEYGAYIRYRLTRMENEWKQSRSKSVSMGAETEAVSNIEFPSV